MFGHASVFREYAAFLQNAGMLWRGIPRVSPWAGMRCPFGAKGAPSAIMRAALSGVHICSHYIIVESETQGSGKTDHLSAPTGRRIPARGETPGMAIR